MHSSTRALTGTHTMHTATSSSQTDGPSPTTLTSACQSLLSPQKGIIRHVQGKMPGPLGTQQKKASLTSKPPLGSLSCSIWDPNNAGCLLREQIKLSTAVNVISDAGFERIHKEKTVQREKVLFLVSQGRERARCGDRHHTSPD